MSESEGSMDNMTEEDVKRIVNDASRWEDIDVVDASMHAKTSFDHWYRILARATIRSEIIEIPEEIMEYIRHDGVILPNECLPENDSSVIFAASDFENGKESDELNKDNKNGCSNDQATGKNVEVVELPLDDPFYGDGEDTYQPTFPDFTKMLNQVMKTLRTGVFVKSNFSAPTDMSWILYNQDVKCVNAEDVYLVLNSSNRISNDLDVAQAHEIKPILVLRQWREINPGTEFRCFVYRGILIGISQRRVSAYFEYIDEARRRIIKSINKFFLRCIKDRCRNGLLNESLTFDVMLEPKGKVTLIDVGLFVTSKDSCLFSWEELVQLGRTSVVKACDSPPEFRYISSDIGIQPDAKVSSVCFPEELQMFSGLAEVLTHPTIEQDFAEFCAYLELKYNK